MVHGHNLIRRRNRFDWSKLHWPGAAAEKLDTREAAPEPVAAPAGGVQTLVSIVYVTQSKTFDGPAVWITVSNASSKTGAAVAAVPTPTGTSDDDDDQDSDMPTTTNRQTAAAPTPTAKDTSAQTTTAATTAANTVAGSKSTTTGASVASVTDTRATASSIPAPGMSGGAKAALALGLLIGLALVLGLILWLVKGKKRQAAMRRLNDEKSSYATAHATAFRPATSGGASVHATPATATFDAPVVAAAAAAPSVRSTTASDSAPRLELRPVTQFSPMLTSDGRSSPRPSAWERPGAASAANDPANPFGNHAETVENGSTPAAGHGAAGHGAAAVGVAAAAAAGVAAARAASNSPPRSEHPPRGPPPPAAPFRQPEPGSPKPSSIRSNATGAPTDLPANEGPGPHGPPAAPGPHGPAVFAGGAAVPRQPPPPGPPGINNVHRVQMDFNPSMEDELRIRAGQLVRMLHEYDDGWALCIRMDRSQQGVVPRTCLSKYPVKPRPTNGPPPAPYRNYNGPPSAPPNGPPAGPPVGPSGKLRGPPPIGSNAPRPLSPSQPPPQGPPYPMGGNQRSASPGPYGPQFPLPQRPRAASGASQQRSMSPGPYGPQGRPVAMADMRRRSNSMGQIQTQNLQQAPTKRMTPPSPLSAGAVNTAPAVERPAAPQATTPPPAPAVAAPVEAATPPPPAVAPAAEPRAETSSPPPVVARKPVPGQAI